MSLFSRVSKNMAIATATRVVGLVIAFFIVGLLTRYLGKEGYGTYATIMAYLATFIAIGDLGLYSLLLRELGKPKIDQARVSSHILTLRLASLGVILVIAASLSFFFPYSREIQLGILIATVSSLFISLTQVLIPIFQAHLIMHRLSLVEMTSRLLQLGMTVLFIDGGMSLLSFIWITVIVNAINFALMVYLARPYVKLSLRFDWKYWRQLIKDAIPIGAGLIFVLIYFRLDTVMISLYHSEAEVGIYSLAYKVLENTIFFPAVFMGLVTPLLTKYVRKNKKKFQEVFQSSLDFIFISLVPVVVGLFLAAQPVIGILGGGNFPESVGVLQLLSFGVGLIFLGSIFGYGTIVLEKQKTAAWVYGGGAVVNFIGNLIVIPQFSYTGAAITTIITELLVASGLIYIVWKYSKINLSLMVLFKSVIAVIPMGIFLVYYAGSNIAWLVLGSVVLYGVSLIGFGVVKIGDIKSLLAQSQK